MTACGEPGSPDVHRIGGGGEIAADDEVMHRLLIQPLRQVPSRRAAMHFQRGFGGLCALLLRQE
jgi:hypothetical protein